MREPAPALHVDQDLLDLCGAAHVAKAGPIEHAPRARTNHAVGRGVVLGLELLHGLEHVSVIKVGILSRRNFEACPEKRNLRVLDAELEQRTCGDLDFRLFLFRLLVAAAKLDQLLAQELELRLVGLEAAQIGCRVGAERDRLDHLQRIGKGARRVEILRNALRIEPAAAGIVAIVEHGMADLDLGIGEPIDGVACLRIEARHVRELVVRCAKPVVVGASDLGHHRLAAVGQAVPVYPEKLLIGNGVVLDESSLFVLLVLAGGGEFRGELVLHGDADRLGPADERGR